MKHVLVSVCVRGLVGVFACVYIYIYIHICMCLYVCVPHRRTCETQDEVVVCCI